MKKNPLFKILFFAFLLTATSDAQELSKKERVEAIGLAKRQYGLFNAKANSDWRAIYSYLTPEIRAYVPFRRFVLQPHAPSGILAPEGDEAGKKSLAEIMKSPYEPFHIAYRVRKISLNKERNFAKVSSGVSVPFPITFGAITVANMQDEYWRKIDGEWFLEWDLKYLVKVSGAAARAKVKRHIPPFIYEINAESLAEWYVEKGEEFEEERHKNELFTKALTLDPYAAASLISKKGINAGELPRVFLDKVLLGRRMIKGYFTPEMELGYWYAVAGDFEKSYSWYLSAHKFSPSNEAAVEALIKTSLQMQNFELATDHFMKLLKITSISNVKTKETLEPLIKNGCAICPKLKRDARLELAKELIYSGRYLLALEIYQREITQRKNWSETRANLLAGKKIKVKEVLGPELAKHISSFTFHEVEMVLRSAGINFFHPAELGNANNKLKQGIILESKPKQERVSYGASYSNGYIKAEASIHGAENIKKESQSESGYLWALLNGKAGNLKFAHDQDIASAGNKNLVEEIAGMKKGDIILISRLSSAPKPMDEELIETLKKFGIPDKRLRGPVSSQALILEKGSKKYRYWEGKRRTRKVFKKSNYGRFNEPVSANSLYLYDAGSEGALRYYPALE